MITVNGHDIIDIDIDSKDVVRITDYYTGDIVWEKNTPTPTPTPITNDYLWVANTYPGTNILTITQHFNITSFGDSTPLYYSKDCENWDSHIFTQEDDGFVLNITLDEGDIVYFKMEGNWSYLYNDTSSNYWKSFSSTQIHVAGGDVSSVSYIRNFNTFTPVKGMFKGDTNLTDASALIFPNRAAIAMYENFFRDCVNLVRIPTLPQEMSISNYCFDYMFAGCTSLTTVPSNYLPATTLGEYCYRGMFQDCTSLTNVPSLPATTLSQDCYYRMFMGCTSLTTVPSNYLPATTLENECYSGMFTGCSSLTNVPSLPATTLSQYCYSNMFKNCTSLTTVPSNLLPATTLSNSCYASMFFGCSSLTSTPSLPSTTLKRYCYDYMFYNCTSLTSAPALPATTLVTDCYHCMFNGCSSLNYIEVGATSWNTEYTYNWVTGVAATGTFVKPSGTSIPTGTNGIPSGWTVVNS